MANWIVSSHGYSDDKSTGWFNITRRQGYVNCNIPSGVELVTYTAMGENMYGNLGWELWDLLVLHTNKEDDAYARRHKAKKGHIVNYAISGPHDDQEYYNWVRPVTGEYACGLFEVGNKTAIESYWPGTSYSRLNDVLARAKAAKVKRVYWLACQALG